MFYFIFIEKLSYEMIFTCWFSFQREGTIIRDWAVIRSFTVSLVSLQLEYSSRPYPFLLTNISCTGNEAALSSCKSGAIGNVPSCKSPHSAGIVCYRRSGITSS